MARERGGGLSEVFETHAHTRDSTTRASGRSPSLCASARLQLDSTLGIMSRECAGPGREPLTVERIAAECEECEECEIVLLR